MVSNNVRIDREIFSTKRFNNIRHSLNLSLPRIHFGISFPSLLDNGLIRMPRPSFRRCLITNIRALWNRIKPFELGRYPLLHRHQVRWIENTTWFARQTFLSLVVTPIDTSIKEEKESTTQIRYYQDRVDFHGEILLKPKAAKSRWTKAERVRKKNIRSKFRLPNPLGILAHIIGRSGVSFRYSMGQSRENDLSNHSSW